MKGKKVASWILVGVIVAGGIGYGAVKNADKLPFDQSKMKVVYKNDTNQGQEADAEEEEAVQQIDVGEDTEDTDSYSYVDDGEQEDVYVPPEVSYEGGWDAYLANHQDVAESVRETAAEAKANAAKANDNSETDQQVQTENQPETNEPVMESGYYSAVLNPNSDSSTHGVIKAVEYDESSITFYGTFSKSESDDFAAYDVLSDGTYTFELTPQTEYCGWEQDEKYLWSKEDALRTCQRLNGLGVRLKVTDGKIDEMSFGS